MKKLCRMATIGENGFIYNTCEDAKKMHLEWKRKFREVNLTDMILAKGLRDKLYDRYCLSIDEFLQQCKCDTPRCFVCSEEEHEGDFCRCESRNIELAKTLRSRGVSKWHVQKDNKAEGESHRERLNPETRKFRKLADEFYSSQVTKDVVKNWEEEEGARKVLELFCDWLDSRCDSLNSMET